jgi:hypothetical protein
LLCELAFSLTASLNPNCPVAKSEGVRLSCGELWITLAKLQARVNGDPGASFKTQLKTQLKTRNSAFIPA